MREELFVAEWKDWKSFHVAQANGVEFPVNMEKHAYVHEENFPKGTKGKIVSLYGDVLWELVQLKIRLISFKNGKFKKKIQICWK